MDLAGNNKIAIFGGGCFWCTEAVFKMLNGVVSVAPGYAGGTKENPTYEEICKGQTGHAEVIKIEYNEEKISFRDLLTIFFATHDPTTQNRQGDDIGPQYRSIILYATDDQKNEAENFIRELNESSREGKKIVTELKPLEKFYEAEDHHKNYYGKNKNAPYCQLVINPKLKKVHEEFSKLLKNN